jgi:hypothetical protein
MGKRASVAQLCALTAGLADGVWVSWAVIRGAVLRVTCRREARVGPPTWLVLLPSWLPRAQSERETDGSIDARMVAVYFAAHRSLHRTWRSTHATAATARCQSTGIHHAPCQASKPAQLRLCASVRAGATLGGWLDRAGSDQCHRNQHTAQGEDDR